MENDIITLAAIVASYVAVFKAFKLVDNKFLPIASLFVASVFVLVPEQIQSKLILISVIGLTAAGVYEMTKNKGVDKR
jgi:predicted metal-binding membrane protein